MTLVPVFEASKTITGTWTGVDYDYPVGIAQARDAVRQGYELRGVAFVAEDTPQSGWLEFRRYVRNGFHFYTTDTSGEHLQGWTYQPLAPKAYLQSISSPPSPRMVALRRWYSASTQVGNAHFFAADVAVTPPPAGWTEEDPTHVHTGWVRKPMRAAMQVTYDGSGTPQGIRVTGGNATGQTVQLNGQIYVMQADDVLVPAGPGNWVGFSKSGGGDWHFESASAQPDQGTPAGKADFTTFVREGEAEVALLDENRSAQGDPDFGYKYSLTIRDSLDRSIMFDPQIVNRAPVVTV